MIKSNRNSNPTIVSAFQRPSQRLVLADQLFEGVGASSPPGEEAGQADGLNGLCQNGHGDGLKGLVLLEDLGEVLRDCQNRATRSEKSVVHVLTVGAEVARKIRPPRYDAPRVRQSGHAEGISYSCEEHTLVGESASGVDQSADGVALAQAAEEGGSPCLFASQLRWSWDEYRELAKGFRVELTMPALAASLLLRNSSLDWEYFARL